MRRSPPDGTEVRDVFVTADGLPSSGLIAEEATVRFVAPSAETSAQGAEGFRERWADWLEPWESYRMYTDEFIDRGDRIVALTRLRGVTKRDRRRDGARGGRCVPLRRRPGGGDRVQSRPRGRAPRLTNPSPRGFNHQYGG